MQLRARIDIPNNRLYITVAGKVTRQNLETLYTDIRFGVADLKENFSVITDLTQCPIAALNGLPVFRKITNFLVENRVGLVVRVVNPKNLVFHQLLNLASRMQGYAALVTTSLEEAEREVANQEEHGPLRFCLNNQPVSYRRGTEVEAGMIIDISVSGCTVSDPTLCPESGDEITIILRFDQHEPLISSLETVALVTAVNDISFIAEFKGLDHDVKEQLWQRLVHESRCEIVQ